MGDTENFVRRAYYRENFDQLHTGHFSITSDDWLQLGPIAAR